MSMSFSTPLRRVLAAALLGAAAAQAQAAELTLEIVGVESAEGAVRASAWTDPETFAKAERAAVTASAKAAPGGVTLVLAGLPDDKPIAVIAYHDEDGDGEMDRFMGMWPTEGYAVSNDPEIAGPPDFDDAAIAPPPPAGPIRMTLSY